MLTVDMMIDYLIENGVCPGDIDGDFDSDLPLTRFSGCLCKGHAEENEEAKKHRCFRCFLACLNGAPDARRVLRDIMENAESALDGGSKMTLMETLEGIVADASAYLARKEATE